MAKQSIILDFINESKKYITKSSIDNLLKKTEDNKLSRLAIIDDKFSFMYIEKHTDIYLVISIYSTYYTYKHTYILKFKDIYTAEYFSKYYSTTYTKLIATDISNGNTSLPYNEPEISYNNKLYNIVIIRYDKNSICCFSLIDSQSRESLLSVVNTSNASIKITIYNTGISRLLNTDYDYSKIDNMVIELNALPEIIQNQILATAVRLSLY